MKNLNMLLVLLSLVGSPALAQDDGAAVAAANVKKGTIVYTADGRRVGRVDRVRDENGAATVGIIYDGRFVNIPVSTLRASDKGLTTSLGKADLKKL
jgi:hypothetical protein